MLQKQILDEKRRSDASQRPAARALRVVYAGWLALLDGRGPLAYMPVLLAIILLFRGASWQMFWTNTDAARYQCYALAFWQGSQGLHLLPAAQCHFLGQFGISQSGVGPLHVLPFEYPPLTLVLFSLPLVAPLLYYQIAFAVVMALVALLISWLLLRFGPRGAVLACAFYLVLGAWGTGEGRFDLVPSALTLLCLIAAERGRWTLAYVALAFGFLFKIYPLLLLPALFLAEQIARERLRRPGETLTIRTLPREVWYTLREAGRWRWQNVLIFAGVILVVSGGFALLNFQGAVLSQLSYFANRPVQVEASGSTVLWLASLVGHPVSVVYSFGSVNLVSDLGSVVALICEILFVLGYALVMLQQWRGRLDLARASSAILLVFIVTGKVFSPQYLIWLIPLLAYQGAFNRPWLVLWSTISVLTTIIYPYLYMLTRDARLAPFVPGFIESVALRNLLLLVLTLALLRDWWRVPIVPRT